VVVPGSLSVREEFRLLWPIKGS